jgi:hypothetical protein
MMAAPDLQRPAAFHRSYTALSDTTRTPCVAARVRC